MVFSKAIHKTSEIFISFEVFYIQRINILKMKNIKLITLLFLLPLAMMAQKNQPQVAIAYVEETVILKAAVGFEKNTKEIDSLKQVYGKEIQESQSQLNTKLETLLKPYNFAKEMTLEEVKAKLKETDKEKLELFVKENDLLAKTGENYNLSLQNKYDQKVQPILTKINTAIETYAKANGIKVVYTLEKISPALAYIDKGVNITEEIIKKL